MNNPLFWQPSENDLSVSNMAKFMRYVNDQHGKDFVDYDQLYQWSIDHIADFWMSIWHFCEVVGEPGNRVLINENQMLASEFFPDAKLNFAQNLLRYATGNKPSGADQDAIIFRGEDQVKRRISKSELYALVSQTAQALSSAGVKEGDRIVAYMPNMPETIVAMLAAASLGAIWSSCSPDFGEQGLLDRFEQVAPKVLIAADGYFYNGKTIDNIEKIASVAEQLSTLEAVVIVPYIETEQALPVMENSVAKVTRFADFIQPFKPTDIDFKQLPFAHPLYILFSSGTTGKPKCIVHSAGGTLLQHLKEHQLHTDIRPGDRLFYFTTCAWMMWNWLVSGLASGATLLLYDGSPFYPNGNVLWDYADEEAMTQFGTSAKYIEAMAKQAVHPIETHQLQHLRMMTSTGSPLHSESFSFVHQHIKDGLYLGSISGGTDIVSCFVLGNPIKPIVQGEIPCRGLGMAVDVWDEQGNSVIGKKGEMVCTKPFVSMPIYFWGDSNNKKYRSAYFSTYPNVWIQGDMAEITVNQGMVIYGRSDAILNPGGVRIGTAEIYRQIEPMPEILRSLVIGQQWQNDVRVVLFVVLNQGVTLNDGLIKKIKSCIRQGASPRHVPAMVLPVADIPETKSGKITEILVRDVIHGKVVGNRGALRNPEALDLFIDLPQLR